MFAVYGWRNAPVIGETPDLSNAQPRGVYVAVKRGEEVAAWLKAHAHVVDRFVCVDDGDDFLPDQPLVLTSMEQGLTDERADACIRALQHVQHTASNADG